MHHATSSNANKVFNAYVICIKMLQGNYAGPRLQRHYNLSTVERIQERLIYYYLLQHVGFSLCQHTEHLLDPSITIHEIYLSDVKYILMTNPPVISFSVAKPARADGKGPHRFRLEVVLRQ